MFGNVWEHQTLSVGFEHGPRSFQFFLVVTYYGARRRHAPHPARRHLRCRNGGWWWWYGDGSKPMFCHILGNLQRSYTGSEDWALCFCVQVAETEPTQGQSAPSTVSHDRTRSAPHHSNSSVSQAKGAPESHILQQPIARWNVWTDWSMNVLIWSYVTCQTCTGGKRSQISIASLRKAHRARISCSTQRMLVSHDRTRSAPHHSNSSVSQAKGAPESHILQQPIARWNVWTDWSMNVLIWSYVTCQTCTGGKRSQISIASLRKAHRARISCSTQRMLVSHDRTRSAPHHSNSSVSQAKGAPESHILQQPIARWNVWTDWPMNVLIWSYVTCQTCRITIHFITSYIRVPRNRPITICVNCWLLFVTITTVMACEHFFECIWHIWVDARARIHIHIPLHTYILHRHGHDQGMVQGLEFDPPISRHV